MTEISAIHHSGLHVRDIEASVRFYVDLLGLELVARQERNGGYVAEIVGYPGAVMRFAFVRPPGGGPMIELIQYVDPAGTPIDTATKNPGTGHVCFSVRDIHAIFDRLSAAGVRFKSAAPVPITEGINKGGFGVYLLDPDDITLEMIQPPA
jgi:catechol 2,3-dioxygenase-like lactoylglutathione lyase family enzyme